VTEPRAAIIEDFASNTVTLFVMDEQGRMMFSDGSWQFVKEGMVPPSDAGIRLPRKMIEPIHKAIESYFGTALHTTTEAKVLREWLDLERRRVDVLFAMMERLLTRDDDR
jgi:hypothetical protein